MKKTGAMVLEKSSEEDMPKGGDGKRLVVVHRKKVPEKCQCPRVITRFPRVESLPKGQKAGTVFFLFLK
jgi:hypothetical protein